MSKNSISGSMANIQKSIFFLFIALLFSCEEQGLIVKCNECTAAEPLKILLDVSLNVNHYGAETKINVYEGNLEDSVLYVTFKTSYSHTTIQVPINKKYTLTATYYISDNKYIAVDSATPGVRYEKNMCSDPCYFVYDKVIDLRLKGSRQQSAGNK